MSDRVQYNFVLPFLQQDLLVVVHILASKNLKKLSKMRSMSGWLEQFSTECHKTKTKLK